MKTKNFFLVAFLTIIFSIYHGYSQNTSFGSGANPANGGNNNSTFGFNALNGVIGTNNSAFGFSALYSVNGHNNSGFGLRALNVVTGTLNSAFGKDAMMNANGDHNSAFGANALRNVNQSYNSAFGSESLLNNNSGASNSSFGASAMRQNTTGSYNVAIGRNALEKNLTGGANISIGFGALNILNSGNNNIAIGRHSANNLSSGNGNVFIGSVTAFSTETLNDRIIIATGGNGLPPDVNRNGIHRIYIDHNGFMGLGLGNDINILPQNRLEIAAGLSNTAGLRFRAINSGSPAQPSNGRVLTVNQNGDVILVDDIGGGVNQNCSTANFIPVNSTTAGQLNCSQIFDNGTSVGVGVINPTANNWSYNWLSLNGPNNTPSSGTVKLDVNGVIRTTGVQSLSDKQFKKDIKPIELALETIQKIDGKTYLWNKEANKDINFDEGLHSGFIAQEFEKVLPHLVATDRAGNKAVNYTELIPYLVEAIKDQQVQINDLKAQLTENFKTQNQDLIELNNTKIISVSPNPSNDFITVSFNVEKSVQNAKLNVHDLNGNVIISLNINDRDNNINRTLQRDNFGKGIYIVSLVVNGKSIDTKKIAFN
jgi:hypothetical protein